MTAQFIPIGEPAQDAERQALRFLVDGLPSGFTVYGNAWIVGRGGVIYELDAVVVAPHALFVVEIKSYRGRIEGTDHDWYLEGDPPERVPSPLKLNRLTAQILKSELKRESFRAGQIWVEGLVFLSLSTDEARLRGPASKDRVHTRKTMLAALQSPELVERLSGRRMLAPTAPAEGDVLRLLTGAQRGPRPVRRIREYDVLETLDHRETHTDFLGTNRLSGAKRVLRVYHIPRLATDAQRDRVVERARWEAQVLGRLGRSEGILSADPPFSDEVGIVLPFEFFSGITLPTWIERYGPGAPAERRSDLATRLRLWTRLAMTVGEAHAQGVVHRLLRPETVLVEDAPDPHRHRITGFELAKQLSSDTTVALTTDSEERLAWAAPEVVAAFSSAQPASDQFSLGALLALLLTGKPLFENTRQLMADRRPMRRVSSADRRIPLSIDEAVGRMLQLRPPDRFPSLEAAISAVQGRGAPTAPPPLDADDLPPKTRIGTDYEIESKLGQGGMAVVYEARHLVSGGTRALKIARQNDAAEDLLRAEHRILGSIDHPNIVKVGDLTKMVEGRLTLVMERVGGRTLRQWLQNHSAPHPALQRKLAEDLLGALEYLEQRGITHKDLKPENLLVGDSGLTVIDFSLAGIPEDAGFGGTALYRDPASARWTHGTDRFAAALCLFEIYAGRHAFDGRVPEPGEPPSLREEDVDPPGLCAFFAKALDPDPERRFGSSRAMRDALLRALGGPVTPSPTPAPSTPVDAATSLRRCGLSRRATGVLARCGVHSVGDLLRLEPNQVEAIHSIGSRTAAEVLGLRASLVASGLSAGTGTSVVPERTIVPDLVDSPESVAALGLPPAVRAALEAAALSTIGAVASSSRSELLSVAGIGPARLSQVVEGLYRFRDRDSSGAHTLDRLWELASRPLSDAQRLAVESTMGLGGIGEPGAIGREATIGLERLDRSVLADAESALEALVDSFGGITRLEEVASRLEEEWTPGIVTGSAFVRLLVGLSPGRIHHFHAEGSGEGIVARPQFDRSTIRAFIQQVEHLASQWPPVDGETARRALATILPHCGRDPLALAVHLANGVELTECDHLYIGPIEPRQSIPFVLARAREDALELTELERRVRRTFGASALFPDPDHLLALLAELDCRVVQGRIVPGLHGSIPAPAPPTPDPLPDYLRAERSPEAIVRDMLRDAAGSRGFRMLVTPPEHHQEIGRSVAAAIGATWLSFEDSFFSRHGLCIAELERAERFTAQRQALVDAAEETVTSLLEEHGRPDRILVLGDTALLDLCESLDLPRRLYDETQSGALGFWVLVVPGRYIDRQPHFNECRPLWHLLGATIPLLNPL